MGQQPPQLGDTTLTKVFVGGLAWETQTDALREHFDKFGEILEAVIISDRFTGRSKGYGFVTFKEAESARKACEDAAPLINGRRANCNLASLGARRFGAKAFAPATPITAQLHPAGATAIAGARGERRAASTAAPLPPTWYYPAVSPPLPSSSPFQHHHPFGFIPFYAGGSFGYHYYLSPPAEFGYSAKLSHGDHPYQAASVARGTVMPDYQLYHHFRPLITGATATPTIDSKPTAALPPKVEQVKGCT